MKRVIFVSLIFLFLCFLKFPLTRALHFNDPTIPDYVGFVRGGICSIPKIGAVLDSFFGFIFNIFYPRPEKVEEEPKVTMREFTERLEYMAKDMKLYTHMVVEESILETCRYQFEYLKHATDNYLDILTIWKDEVNSPGGTSNKTKNKLSIQYDIISSKLEESLVQFSIKHRMKYLAKLYIDTAVLYSSLLRDGHFHGESMGLHPKMVNGTNMGITIATKIRLHSGNVQNKYMEMLEVLLVENYKSCPDPSHINCRSKYGIPQWHDIISVFLYSDPSKYDRRLVLPISRGNLHKDWVLETRRINLVETDSKTDRGIFVQDFNEVSRVIKVGILWDKPYQRSRQNFDFLTASNGVHISSYLDGRAIREPAGAIYKNDVEPNYEIAFYQNYLLNFPKNTLKFRIYFAATKGQNLNKFQLKVIKLNPNGIEMRRIKSEYSGRHETDTVYLDNKYSFRQNATRITSQQNIKYGLYDRYYFETESFNVTSPNITFVLLPIKSFSVHLLSLEIIID
ncbi:hypothetical protein ACTA71_010967 [Dictyostelium dimigraforme]